MTVSYKQVIAYLEKMMQGERIDIAEYLAMFNETLASESYIKTELGKYTIVELKGLFRGYMQAEKKDRMIIRVYEQLYDLFMIPHEKGIMSWIPSQETMAHAVKRYMDAMTQEMLNKHSNAVMESKKKLKKAIESPETLEEFQTFINNRGMNELTPEQKELLDMVVAMNDRKKVEEERKLNAVVTKVDLEDGIDFVVTEGIHTKKNVPIWTIRLTDRVPRDQWEEVNKKAAKFGARWSGWGTKEQQGWIFYDADTAAQFLELKNGNGSVLERWENKKQEQIEKTAARLAEMAEKKEDDAQDSLTTDRKVNTSRRAGQAAYAEENARENIKMAQILACIAEAMKNKEVFLLDGIRHMTEVETLEKILARAKYARIKNENAEYEYYEKNKDREPTLEDIRFADMPYGYITCEERRRLSALMAGKRGTKDSITYLNAMVSKNDICYVKGTLTFGALKEILDRLTDREINKAGILARFDEYERVIRIGLRSSFGVRAALREYFRLRDVHIPPVDKARSLELDLVGVKIPGFFPTPIHVAQEMVEIGRVNSGRCILEPSAGSGRIASVIRDNMQKDATLDCCEIDGRLVDILQLRGFYVISRNFIEYADTAPQKYDRIIMNPPFEKNQDVAHVRRAFDLLLPGGILVSIMSEHSFFAEGKIENDFRNWLDSQIVLRNESLPQGTFKDAGTNVSTRIIAVQKGE